MVQWGWLKKRSEINLPYRHQCNQSHCHRTGLHHMCMSLLVIFTCMCHLFWVFQILYLLGACLIESFSDCLSFPTSSCATSNGSGRYISSPSSSIILRFGPVIFSI